LTSIGRWYLGAHLFWVRLRRSLIPTLRGQARGLTVGWLQHSQSFNQSVLSCLVCGGLVAAPMQIACFSFPVVRHFTPSRRLWLPRVHEYPPVALETICSLVYSCFFGTVLFSWHVFFFFNRLYKLVTTVLQMCWISRGGEK